jgi:hypothetical protein
VRSSTRALTTGLRGRKIRVVSYYFLSAIKQGGIIVTGNFKKRVKKM